MFLSSFLLPQAWGPCTKMTCSSTVGEETRRVYCGGSDGGVYDSSLAALMVALCAASKLLLTMLLLQVFASLVRWSCVFVCSLHSNGAHRMGSSLR